MRGWVVMVAVSLALSLVPGLWPSGATARAQADVPRFEPAACSFRPPDGEMVECGYLVVPEDRTQPNGPTIRLHVAIFKSHSEHPAPDPIIYLHGGPGGDALEVVHLLFPGFAPLVAERDFIMFDQRGTGYSEPALACPELTELFYNDLDSDLLDVASDSLDALTGCHDRLAQAGDLGMYHSAASAADLADLRRVLGYEAWNLYGISYGTRLALTVMRDYPDGIRSVILDSTYPLQADLYADTPSNAGRAFQALFDGCEADPECRNAYPNLEQVFYDLAGELDWNPVEVQVIHPLTQKVYYLWLDGYMLVNSLFDWLYDTRTIPLLPRTIFEIRNGEYGMLERLLKSSLAQMDFVSEGMYYSVQCHEEVPFMDDERAVDLFGELDSRLQDYFRGSRAGISLGCMVWDIAEAEGVENEPVTSDIPTLVLAGEYDPITPPAWGRLAAETLSHSFYYLFPGYGHGVSVSGACPMQITLAFLRNPSRAPNADCIGELGGPAFWVP